MALKDLFGGAIVAELPANFVDVSAIRQLPDNQEVFLYPVSNVSIVIEVLQRVSEPVDDVEAVKFHFEALAHDNEAISSTIQFPSVIHNDQGDKTPSPIVLRGSQRICKSNASAADDVDISIALFRVHSEEKSADLVVSANTPRNLEGGVGKEHAATITSDFEPSDFDILVSSLHFLLEYLNLHLGAQAIPRSVHPTDQRVQERGM